MTHADLVVLASEVDQRLSWGMGALALLILLGMLVGLVVFGGGREHS